MLIDDTIDAVLLDAGGVLVLPDPKRMREVLAPLGAHPGDDTCRLAHYAGMREVDRLGRADWPLVDRVVARSAGVPEDRIDEALASIERIYLAEDWVPAPGAAEALRALEAAGLQLGIVSNATGRMEQLLLEHRICGLEGEEMAKVAVVIDSHVVGVEKPDPRIFSLALNALEVPPQRCVFVGDSVHFDVEGARNAGIRPLHLDPFGLCPAGDHEHLASLGALTADLERDGA
ncbi:MAG: HAD family hydrolase [Acidimicrobiales bacterium]|jgi:putative hydrolase of the HAD superfamily